MHRQLAGSGLRTARPHSLAELSWNRAGLGLVLPAYPRADLVAVPRMSASDRRQFQCAAKRAVICLFVPCQVMEVQVLPALMHGLKPGPEVPAFHTVHSYATRLCCPPVAGPSKAAKRKRRYRKCSTISNRRAGDSLFEINASTDSRALFGSPSSAESIAMGISG